MKPIKKILSKIQKIFTTQKGKKGVAGIWLEEEPFLNAISQVRKKPGKNFTAITPYPVHGLEDVMEIPRSWIPWVTFIFGIVGCTFGVWFTWWTSAVDWPILVGGKPFWSLPAFMPVIFELTILFSALSSIGALLYACGLPKINPPVIDSDLSSHKFAIFIPEAQSEKRKELKTFFSSLKSDEVVETEF